MKKRQTHTRSTTTRYPSADSEGPRRYFVKIGVTRSPRAGEWYLSGAIPEAYQAQRALAGVFPILREVVEPQPRGGVRGPRHKKALQMAAAELGKRKRFQLPTTDQMADTLRLDAIEHNNWSVAQSGYTGRWRVTDEDGDEYTADTLRDALDRALAGDTDTDEE